MRLVVHQQLARDTQMTLEGPLPITNFQRLDLETISKVSSSQEQDGSLGMSITKSEPRNATLGDILEMDEQQAHEQWEEVHKNSMEHW